MSEGEGESHVMRKHREIYIIHDTGRFRRGDRWQKADIQLFMGQAGCSIAHKFISTVQTGII
jgi:hypothetical protein